MIQIPIKNIYYMLRYSQKYLDQGEKKIVGSSDYSSLLELFADILLKEVQIIFQRGLIHDYKEFSETLPGVRGKLDLGTTLKKNLLQYQLTHCYLDDYVTDAQENRIIKSTLAFLLKQTEVSEKIKSEISRLIPGFREVSTIDLHRSTFRRIRLDVNKRYYRLALQICELIANNISINEESGQLIFLDYVKDEYKMRQLFESFLYNFYRIESPVGSEVSRPKIKWDVNMLTSSDSSLIPGMQTDIVIRNDQVGKVIIDAKFTSAIKPNQYHKETLISGHLYQLFTYLQNQEDEYCTGILLYPEIDAKLREGFMFQEHLILVATVDLNEDWRLIHDELLELVFEFISELKRSANNHIH